MTQRVMLGSQHNHYTVDDATFAQIEALVQAGKLCTADYNDQHPYQDDNPCVGKDICLLHVLMRQSYLTQVNIVGATTDSRSIYFFMDAKGQIYTSIENESTEARLNLTETMTYHGFNAPTKVESRGKSVDFYSHYATLHGDLLTASVIVLSYNHYGEKIKGLFLLYKNGIAKELSKKNDIYHQAQSLVEQTKDPDGNYNVNGTPHKVMNESDILLVISQLESAVYNVVRTIQNGHSHKEESNES